LSLHRRGRLLQGDKYADVGVLAVQNASEIAHVLWASATTLHREDNLLDLLRLVVEVQPPVDTLVGSLLLLDRACADQAKRPPLELERVFFGKLLRATKILGFTDDLVGLFDLLPVRVEQSTFDQ